ncbi:1-(5-phosphoribosyl)-5-[(5-phosphoribosylamino)methylideneamino]imidazole-4-carboxamide isomerase [Aminicella lysinilytica]|uniref:1-(5-phosphoribosyl)-5-[(5-phosphoribosylamino)methylideneamino] imidazole-4-carboxamide isomerase n=1 Tax=Aminicella lysinilytica TaxID=433323 RepID=A0A4R6Q6C3_9FIRM|nr:1-(5-phosphoribosyl)-5-[(5-phosphoribosylamino)methylideneamino]imidazole-4-carboxamide isomerase [Aminicella lysinilytica]TDP57326.1 1-(5-phosphoribosyl)-5-[(5-phosphoribosylamino)methylideneamino] imidazole-4-carboxamide isomerase [Aminicella lysinilytica]
MKIFPAIDLKDGQVVRLLKGDYNKMTVYGQNPLAVAKEFEAAGAEYLHVVDLDGAIDGDQPNFSAVADIIEGTDLKVEIGGGIRNEEIIVDYAQIGALRVIIGTMAIKDPEFTDRMIKKHSNSVAVGVDITGVNVAIDGWTNVTDITVDEMFQTLIDEGVSTIICTDIAKDGAMEGTNLELYRKLVKYYGGYADIIASGGISSMDDLQALADLGVDGAIIGKALYTGALDLGEIIKKFGE